MNALVVLAFCVNDVHRLVLRDKNTLVAYLSTHFTIERSSVENQFVEDILLLCYFAVTKDMTFVFRVVIAYELLFTGSELHPVGILDLCSIAGTLFLFLHLLIEFLLINSKSVLTANQFGKVKRESISVEQTEGGCSVQNGLFVGFQFIHRTVKKVDAPIKSAQEGIFFLFHHTSDKITLCGKFGERIAHLLDEDRQQLVQESFSLVEESIGIADSTAKNTADNVSCLGIGRQLTVGNGEGNSTKVVGTDAHCHVNFLLLPIF